jgi:hypothetical protein
VDFCQFDEDEASGACLGTSKSNRDVCPADFATHSDKPRNRGAIPHADFTHEQYQVNPGQRA